MCVPQRDARLPIDVIIFYFQALISAWLLRYFYYSVCVLREWERKRKGERGGERGVGRSVFVCAYVWVGASQSGLSKSSRYFPVLSGWLENCGRSHFQPKPVEQQSYAASSVIPWWELVESAPKIQALVFSFFSEQHFDFGLRSTRLEQVDRPGWLEWDDMINCITQKLVGIILPNC